MLLVDSEGPVQVTTPPWEYVKSRRQDAWEKPKGASDEQRHLMVACMEAWFFAERKALYPATTSSSMLPSTPATGRKETLRIGMPTVARLRQDHKNDNSTIPCPPSVRQYNTQQENPG